MSGFVVIFNRDGSPVDHGVFERMMAKLNHRGPDGFNLAYYSSIAMGHHHFWTTPEEVGEQQPVTDPSGRVHLVFNGRLDNRRELLSALGSDDSGGQCLSDAALLLLLFARWENACFERILGSFAVVIYDEYKRRIVCARDALGNRTLFFHCDHRLVVIASEENALLTHPALSKKLDEARLARYFAVEGPAAGTTFYSDVRELEPAHVLVLGQRKQQTHRYWEVDLTERLVYQSDTEYAEHFQYLLSESVRCRLRSPSPPAIMMSGGLDSTSVAALAAKKFIDTGQSRLRTFSWVFDELKTCDERVYMDTLTQRYNFKVIRVLGDDCWPLRDLRTWPQNPNTPENDIYRRLKERLYQTAGKDGCRILLTGYYGDHLYTGGDTFWLMDLLREGRLREVIIGARENIRRNGFWASLRNATAGLREQLPTSRQWRYWRGKDKPAWLTRTCWQQVDRAADWSVSWRDARRSEQCRMILGSLAAHGESVESYHANRANIETRNPYRDQRIATFMLSVPAHQLYGQDGHKQILRNAMQGFLPEKIRLRQQPTGLYALYNRGMAERESQLVKELLLQPEAIMGHYICPKWLAKAVPGQMDSELEELIVWLCVSFQLWLRTRSWE